MTAKSNKYDHLMILFSLSAVSFISEDPVGRFQLSLYLKMSTVGDSCSGNESAIARVGNYFLLLKVDLMFTL